VTQAPEEDVSPGLLPGPDVLLFHHDESYETVILRLIGDADVVLWVNCADRRANFEVRGYFAVPHTGADSVA
jgi:hypothetical protein